MGAGTQLVSPVTVDVRCMAANVVFEVEPIITGHDPIEEVLRLLLRHLRRQPAPLAVRSTRVFLSGARDR